MFNKKVFLIITGLSSLLFLQGCIVTQADIGVLKTQIAALNQTLQDVQRNQASVDQQTGDITDRLTQSVDDIRNFDYKLDAITAKLDDISARLDGAGEAGYKMPPADIYAQAKTQFDAKQYESAASGFSLYLKEAPQGAEAQGAWLFLAGSYFNIRDYQKAAVAAAALLEKYPEGRYTANVRILYARSILPLDKKDEAVKYLKSVVQDFKNTPEAAEAARLLEGIK
ncbi:MAG: outer membrane protein assembly factor BamD [Elusimicrobiota bacterium]|jgi:TolA-binding protein|nr:outer membrane protein assembly factor BamD [Elusimicrobiota bacterium]